MELNVPPMTKTKFVQVLQHYGSQTISSEKLEAQIAAGAPVNDDGSINIVNYTAWLLKELCHAE